MKIEKTDIYRKEVPFKELEDGQVFLFEYTKKVYVKITPFYPPFSDNAFNLEKNETVHFNGEVKVIPVQYEFKVWGY